MITCHIVPYQVLIPTEILYKYTIPYHAVPVHKSHWKPPFHASMPCEPVQPMPSHPILCHSKPWHSIRRHVCHAMPFYAMAFNALLCRVAAMQCAMPRHAMHRLAILCDVRPGQTANPFVYIHTTQVEALPYHAMLCRAKPGYFWNPIESWFSMHPCHTNLKCNTTQCQVAIPTQSLVWYSLVWLGVV
jgi:hypothetical protein